MNLCHCSPEQHERVLERLHLLLNRTETIMADLAAVLTEVSAVSASVDALAARIPAPTPVVDLQPAVDALVAVKAKLDAIDPAVVPPKV